MGRQVIWFWSQRKPPGDLMTRKRFVINVGKVTGGEGQTTSLLKLWKRDYYPLIALHYWAIPGYIASARLNGLKPGIDFTLYYEP